MSKSSVTIVLLTAGFLAGCASTKSEQAGTSHSFESSASSTVNSEDGEEPVSTISSVRGITLGEPLAISLDFDGNLLVADGLPGRVLRIDASGDKALEFQQPTSSPNFYPSDLQMVGFNVYALDKVGRVLVRFNKDGAYLDQLINFDEVFDGTNLVSPVGFDVGPQGNIAVSDVQNHQIILFNSYLQVELAFGNYGSYPGQFASPEGVSFTRRGDLLVTDSGNRRVQHLDSSGGFIRAIPADETGNPLQKPRRAVMTDAGSVYVADPVAGRVFVFDADGNLVRTITPASVDKFKPTDVAVASSGLIYVTDSASGSIYVFR